MYTITSIGSKCQAYTAIWIPHHRSGARVTKQLSKVLATTTSTKQSYSHHQRDTIVDFTPPNFLTLPLAFSYIIISTHSLCKVNRLDPDLNVHEIYECLQIFRTQEHTHRTNNNFNNHLFVKTINSWLLSKPWHYAHNMY